MAEDRPQQATRGRTATEAPAGEAGAGAFLARHGNKLMLAASVGLLLVVLLQYRRATERAARQQVADSLTAARVEVDSLRRVDAAMTWDQIDQDRQRVASGVEPLLATLVDQTDDARARAAALVVRGDLNWLLANRPTAPAGTTQPAVETDDPAARLATARSAYRQAIDAPGALPVDVAAAHMGLAAIAENRGEWDAAKAQYDAVLVHATTPKGIKDVAQAYLDRLDAIRMPSYLSPTTTPTATGTGVPFLPPAAPLVPSPPLATTTTAPATPQVADTISATAPTGGDTTPAAPVSPTTTAPATGPVQ